MPRPDLWLALALVFCSQAVQAQSLIERLGHERLMAKVADPTTRLAPFTTDGCSGGMSDVWVFVADALPAFAEVHGAIPPWQECCITHDRAYHDAAGATEARQSATARLEADSALRACVIATADGKEAALSEVYGVGEEAITTSFRLIAAAMFRAVRAGGAPCSGLPWRWGYGYPGCS